MSKKVGKVFVDVGTSLDGYLAGPDRGPKKPLGEGGPSIHAWMFQQARFRKALKLAGNGGETGVDNEVVSAIFDRIGANVMGKRMFDEGEVSWPEDAPFHTPVFVLTKEKRTPWTRPGGTTFYFVNDGLANAIARAREAAGSKDVRISGGADVIRQALEAGYVEELGLHVAPVLLGDGLRLFDGVAKDRFTLEIMGTLASPRVMHLRYAVKPR